MGLQRGRDKFEGKRISYLCDRPLPAFPPAMLFKIEVENDEVKCEETEEAAPLISQIDADDIELAHCDLCRIPLGPQADSADSRAFRCFNCELSVQCETCCSQTHLASDSHVLQVSA
jgi:hypothetical protein